jgi:serine/threonine protein kinase
MGRVERASREETKMRLEQGHLLGPYEILAQLGAGGMGEVYQARDTRLDRLVAIKVLPTHLSANPTLRQRFDREAHAISSLSHPHICTLFDVGHEAGIDYLVMEFLAGTTLASKLADGALPLQTVLRVGRQIAEALSAAHRHGVVHRDLKPGNVMLTPSGVKLMDFGLARIGQQVDASTSTLAMTEKSEGPRSPLTAEGSIIGTFQYMAPEQIEGQEANSRSDIFALGAVLYEMATGRPAFQGKSRASLIASILKDQPSPVSSIQAMTPPALDRIVQVCLEKDPAARWQTAHDVALQLQWIAEGGSDAGVPRPVTRRRRSRERVAWVTAALLGLAVGVLGARELLRGTGPPPRTIRYQIPSPAGLISVGTPRISPDGHCLAFNATDSTGLVQLWIHPLDALTAHPLPGTEGAGRPFWSPDSRSLAFFAGSQLKRVSVAGGPVRVILDGMNGADGTWSTQGTILFDRSGGDAIRAVPAAGGLARPVTRIDPGSGQSGHGWPLFLPDGKHFLFLASYALGSRDSLILGELGSFQTRALGAASSLVEYCKPGYVLWVDGGVLLARPFDRGSLTFAGDPFPVTTELSTGSVGLANFSTSRNGVLVYQRGRGDLKTLTWVDRSGKELGTVGPAGDYAEPDVDSTETRIIVDLRTGPGSSDLWLLDAVRSTATRFTFEPGGEICGLWSPDNSRILFAAGQDLGWRLKLKLASGASEPVSLQADTAGTPMSWSPDGRIVIVNRLEPASQWDLWAIPLAGDSPPIPVATGPFSEIQGKFSPDGRWIAYGSNESGQFQVYVRSFPGAEGKWQVSVERGTEPQWRQDGKELFYLTRQRELMAVSVDSEGEFRSGTPHPLFRAQVSDDIVTRSRYVASRDGQRFLLVKVMAGGPAPTTVVLNWTAEVGGAEGQHH